MASHVNYSEQTAGIIDQEIREIIDTSLKKARKLLAENKKLLDNMARLLVERETIFTEEVDMLMEGKSVEEIMQFMDQNERSLRENPFKRKSVIISEKEAEQKKAKKAKETAQTEKASDAQEGAEGKENQGEKSDKE